MSREENVLKFYMLANKLKDVVRTGWKDWHVKRERVESIAEHIYGVQMLAIAIQSEYKYDIDLSKVLFMLAIHELGEIKIGDLTQFQISREEKEKMEHEAVHEILSDLLSGEDIEELFLEFDKHKTPESKFAYMCDKLECDLQSKIYDDEECVSYDDQQDNKTFYNKDVQELIRNGCSFSEMWMTFGLNKYPYDENFRNISMTAMNMDTKALRLTNKKNK